VNRSSVGRDGQHDVRPEREALTGAAGAAGARSNGSGGRRGGRRRRRDEPQFTSYYGRPIIKEPTWEALDIAGYLFLGGLAGASSIVGAGASATGRPGLARTAKCGALGAISLSLVALVHDLGRPDRFLHMLRVVKPTSPMSVGVWLLSAYAPIAGVAAASDVSGRARPLGAAATATAAGRGSAVASYTAVLVADTAVPAWHEGFRELPFVFVGSAAAAAAGLGLLGAPARETGPVRRLAIGGVVVEVVAVKLLERRLGSIAETLEQGRAGRLMHAAEALSATGVVLAALPITRRSRAAAAVAGASLLAASAATRFGLFAAGVASARDPKYTVGPQRERLAARATPEGPARAARTA
jgi:formate-dependent nitrite reductase membrane component NrfD